MAGHAQLKCVMTECSKTQIRLTGLIKAAFPRAKFLCHISHALQSLLTDFCGIITVNLYSRTDTDEKWINNNYNFGINDCRACNLWQRKFGRVLEPLIKAIFVLLCV